MHLASLQVDLMVLQHRFKQQQLNVSCKWHSLIVLLLPHQNHLTPTLLQLGQLLTAPIIPHLWPYWRGWWEYGPNEVWRATISSHLVYCQHNVWPAKGCFQQTFVRSHTLRQGNILSFTSVPWANQSETTLEEKWLIDKYPECGESSHFAIQTRNSLIQRSCPLPQAAKCLGLALTIDFQSVLGLGEFIKWIMLDRLLPWQTALPNTTDFPPQCAMYRGTTSVMHLGGAYPVHSGPSEAHHCPV